MNNRVIFGAAGFCLSVVFMGDVLAQTSAPPPVSVAAAPAPVDYSALTAKSAALTPDQKAQAQQIFATAFSIWQSGDFTAAEIAFKQGLDMDPANASANYYYGDCLARRKDKVEARDYLNRAVTFGGTSVEAFKARGELQQLSVVPTNIADMDNDELTAALMGTWTFTNSYAVFDMQITSLNGSQLVVTGKQSGCMLSSDYFKHGTIQGAKLTFAAEDNSCTGKSIITVTLDSPTSMSGSEDYGSGTMVPISAVKKAGP